MSVLATIGAAGLGGGLDWLANERSMAHSAEQAEQQMFFQKKMSDTAIRRATADMRAAGLNPVMAVPGAASSPSGAMGQAPVARPGTSAIQAASAVQAQAQMRQQTEQMRQQTRLLELEAEKQEVLKGFFDMLGPIQKRIEKYIEGEANSAGSISDKVKEAGKNLVTGITGVNNDAEPGADWDSSKEFMRSIGNVFNDWMEKTSKWSRNHVMRPKKK